jgi:tyrosyl-tRNA synthetase
MAVPCLFLSANRSAFCRRGRAGFAAAARHANPPLILEFVMVKSGFLAEAKARGFVFQCTDEAALDAALLAGPVAGYTGFDPTAESLHVGSLTQIMLLRLLQKHGHKVVVLMGGGTGRIGDPSFREEARQLMTEDTLAKNLAGIRRVFDPFLRFGEAESGAIMVNNAEWLDRLGYVELLREVGVHFSINRMLSFESVKSRLDREQGLTFLEFNYSILQSYDFRELSRRFGVSLQMGGSDQWGNIVSGIDLIRRTDQKTVFGLTTPLIASASGAKMGKSAAGAVWLTADKLSPYHYWQFWRNTEDADVGRFLRLFTDLPLDEIARLEALGGAEINAAKIVLANEATALAHGRAAADEAAETARKTFEEGVSAAGLPHVDVAAAEFPNGIPAFELFFKAGLAGSKGEARRLIRGGGARVDDVVVADEGQIIGTRGAVKLSAGKKQHVMATILG